MKCFEKLVREHILCFIPPTFDPHQFAYRENRATEDAVATALHAALYHLEQQGSYARLLFIDFSSAFNTILPSRLVDKLSSIGIPHSTCLWIKDFLTGRTQRVRIGHNTSMDLNLSTGSPQGYAFQKTVEKFGGIDIVCNNAGILNEGNWEKSVAINLNGVIRGTYLALNHMKKENGGRGGVIINIASLAGLGPFRTCPVYTATKHGVVGFSRAIAMASAAAGYGVRINMICPSFARTALLDALTSEERCGEYYKLQKINHKLLEAFGVLEVSDVVKAFESLVLDESQNGAAVSVQPEGFGYVNFPTVEDLKKNNNH
ncbi:15-hydroxyprostaglandin dehydrogenase [NAD(+)]-like [Engraulis encrasicolus]|uniref:15-hydroxyprostaglandin dehydrogenase [NAD(+)]-like n=1 Tax=Engraulis encrasicolus TaxID=184585 RepID=UPI002FCEB1AE